MQNFGGVAPVVAQLSVKDSKGAAGRATTSFPSYLSSNGSFVLLSSLLLVVML